MISLIRPKSISSGGADSESFLALIDRASKNVVGCYRYGVFGQVDSWNMYPFLTNNRVVA